MRLTNFTDYCLRTLMFVALNGERVTTIDEISEHYRINRNHVVKVVFCLAQLGYLQTLRGKGGGILLAGDPAEINIGKVVRETEQDIALVECFQAQDCVCVIEPACVLKKALYKALAAFFDVLDGYTLADLLKPRRTLSQLLAVTPA